jgi:hypothetical protein
MLRAFGTNEIYSSGRKDAYEKTSLTLAHCGKMDDEISPTSVRASLNKEGMPEIALSWDYEDAIVEIENRRRLAETYTTPLIAENESSDSDAEDDVSESHSGRVKRFLKTFNVNDKAKEIRNSLEEHPASVCAHFVALVPIRVEHKDFCARYFLRCDIDRIVRDWTFRDGSSRSDIHRNETSISKNPVCLLTDPIISVMSWDKGRAIRQADLLKQTKEVDTAPLQLDWDLDNDKSEEDELAKFELIEARLFL